MKSLLLALLLASWTSTSAYGFDAANVVPATGTIEYAFTPGGDAAGLIVRTIDSADSQILVQAFSFTHRDIAEALIRAHLRGVDVQIIADREQTDALESSAMQAMVGAGLAVFTDAEHWAAHNKVIILDRNSKRPSLITGSFNFTFAAQNRNAENVLVLRGIPELAQAFYANWQQHRLHAIALGKTRSK